MTISHHIVIGVGERQRNGFGIGHQIYTIAFLLVVLGDAGVVKGNGANPVNDRLRLLAPDPARRIHIHQPIE
jgi:hypothetical protein